MNWHEAFEPAKEDLARQHEKREQVLKATRGVIQNASKAIRCLHRGELDGAQAFLNEATSVVRGLRSDLATTPNILYAGYLQDAEKEVAEAAILFAILSESEMPTCESLGFEAQTYLHGAAEAASELRRTILDDLRGGRHDRVSHLLDEMDSIYEELVMVDYPDGLTGGLRRTTDALRAVLERTRGDVTLAGLMRREN